VGHLGRCDQSLAHFSLWRWTTERTACGCGRRRPHGFCGNPIWDGII